MNEKTVPCQRWNKAVLKSREYLASTFGRSLLNNAEVFGWKRHQSDFVMEELEVAKNWVDFD